VPTWLTIILLLLVLGVVVALAFTAWRLLANLNAVMASVNRLNAELTPALEDLTRQTEEIAQKAARLQRRQAGRSTPSGT
jgi:uncharacterized protein YoxC